MKRIISLAMWVLISLAGTLAACSKASADPAATDNQATSQMKKDTTATAGDVKVIVETTMGNFTVLLYGDTPGHRDNFLKLAREGFYNGTLFHRVIDQFMVQGGDPESRNAPAGKMLGSGDPGYTLEAEIVYPRHFHKRGALAAARQGDQVNPQRRSSGSQFYVVTGQKVPEAAIGQLEARMQNTAMQSIFNGLAAQHADQIRQLQAAGDREGLETLRQQLIAQTESQYQANPVHMTEEMKQAYVTQGGAPHLDGQYTVFGEVIDGMDTIDKIEKVATDGNDRPTTDVKILKMTVVE